MTRKAPNRVNELEIGPLRKGGEDRSGKEWFYCQANGREDSLRCGRVASFLIPHVGYICSAHYRKLTQLYTLGEVEVVSDPRDAVFHIVRVRSEGNPTGTGEETKGSVQGMG